jgi:dynein heavy chain
MYYIDTICVLQALKTTVAELCVKIHASIEEATQQFWAEMKRRYYITPSSYMELIRLYSRMLTKHRSDIMGSR